MRVLTGFNVGILVAAIVTSIAAYLAGKSVLAEVHAMHDRAIDFYTKAHADLLAVIARGEAKASTIGKAITG